MFLFFAFLLFLQTSAVYIQELISAPSSHPTLVHRFLNRKISPPARIFLRKARQADDPSCGKLKGEYDQVCFVLPPSAALVETKAFCDAFVETCSNLLKKNVFTNLEDIQIDFTSYCKRHKERFRYVCPDPIRFHTFADDALAFCARYIERCPGVELPGEPVPFKDPMAGHIYTREIEAFCKPLRRMARNYCTDPDLIKVPKYAVPCYVFKVNCIDVYTKVIYERNRKLAEEFAKKITSSLVANRHLTNEEKFAYQISRGVELMKK